MPFRLFATAAMVAIGATLGLMVARALTIPLMPIDTAETDALLLHHLGLGLFGALALLPLLMRAGGGGLRRGLLWGGAIFLIFSLFPWLAQPETRPGRVPAGLGLWLFSVAASAAGLWLLAGKDGRRDWQRQLAGGILLVLPLLLGFVLGERPERLLTPGFGEALLQVPELAVWRDLGLNLLFWLLLGVFSGLAMRRAMPSVDGKSGAVEAPPEG